MNQKEYQTSGAGTSQCERILARLREARGQEVSGLELARIGSDSGPHGYCMVHSRIADLRKRQHDIPPARTQKVNGRMHSFYRLNEAPSQEAAA